MKNKREKVSHSILHALKPERWLDLLHGLLILFARANPVGFCD
jgi:hypothetical protein